jgi:tetratricopeptide (TPR) repeat protein/predicted Ser/Thr protein kinase
MGSVYLARDPEIGRLVAIKLLKEEFDEDQRRRFKREALLAGKLPHVNIITIYDVGDHHGRPFIAMSYIRGETLAQLIHRRAPLSAVRKVRIIEELCAGLHAAHSEGIVHRDIKPANVMVDQSGVVKILDFGIARLLSEGSLKTQDGTIIGSYNYMSPEQIAGKPLDHRSDIFAVGTILYELLSSIRAFRGSVGDGLLYRVVHEPPQSLRELDSHLDNDLERIVMRALEKDPDRRYSDIEAMRRDLARVKRRLVGAEIGPLITAAEEALRDGDYERALSKSQEALAVEPDDSRALDVAENARKALDAQQIQRFLENARAELDRQAFTAAAREIEAALRIDSSASDSLMLRDDLYRRIIDHARQLISEERYDRALAHLTEVERLHPRIPQVATLLKEARDAQGRREQKDVARAQAREDLKLARTLHTSGKHREALKHIEARLVRLPIEWDDLWDEVKILREGVEDALTREVIEVERARGTGTELHHPDMANYTHEVGQTTGNTTSTTVDTTGNISDVDEKTVVIHRTPPARPDSTVRSVLWILVGLGALVSTFVAVRC